MCDSEGFDSYIGKKPRRDFMFDYQPPDEHTFSLFIDDMLKDKDVEILMYKSLKDSGKGLYRLFIGFKVARHLNLNNLPGMTSFENEQLLPDRDDNVAMMMRESTRIIPNDDEIEQIVRSKDLMIYLRFFDMWLNGLKEELNDSRVPFIDYWLKQDKDKLANERPIKKIKK